VRIQWGIKRDEGYDRFFDVSSIGREWAVCVAQEKRYQLEEIGVLIFSSAQHPPSSYATQFSKEPAMSFIFSVTKP